MKQAVKVVPKYSIEDLEGVDVGQAFVEIIRWTGEGAFEYHGRPADGVEVLGRGEILFDGKETKYGTGLITISGCIHEPNRYSYTHCYYRVPVPEKAGIYS